MKVSKISIFAMVGIAIMFILAGNVEANECNPYTYENCSGLQLRAVARVQFQQRNGLQENISFGEKMERIKTGKPTTHWHENKEKYNIILVGGIYTQKIRSTSKQETDQ